MEEKIKEITPSVIEKQKETIAKEIATLNLHLEFHKGEFAKKKPKTKEERETIAHQKLQTINPIEDNIAFKTRYYEYLCRK